MLPPIETMQIHPDTQILKRQDLVTPHLAESNGINFKDFLSSFSPGLYKDIHY